ncbi:MAG: RNA 2',3'-cyclic phosphodiesterase [Candidatus Acidiferrales bacterium]
MRLFVALELTPAIRDALRALVAKLEPTGADIRWVRSEGMHLTLKFIGEVPAEKLAPIKTALAAVSSPAGAELAFRGLGFFPTERRPRVIWVGIEASANLAPLAAEIESALVPLGIPAEKRAFVPHLTLGRFKSAARLRELQEEIAAVSSPDFGRCEARSLALFQSRLSPKGAEYTRLEEFSFVRS